MQRDRDAGGGLNIELINSHSTIDYLQYQHTLLRGFRSLSDGLSRSIHQYRQVSTESRLSIRNTGFLGLGTTSGKSGIRERSGKHYMGASQASGEVNWTIPPRIAHLYTPTSISSRLYHILPRGEKRNLEHHIISAI